MDIFICSGVLLGNFYVIENRLKSANVVQKRRSDLLYYTTFLRLLHLQFAMTNFERTTTTSPDCNGILFGGGRSKVEPVAKKIQWKAGKASKKERKLENEGWKFTIIENKNLLNNVRLELLRRIRFLQ